jgi:hypothetical protein
MLQLRRREGLGFQFWITDSLRLDLRASVFGRPIAHRPISSSPPPKRVKVLASGVLTVTIGGDPLTGGIVKLETVEARERSEQTTIQCLRLHQESVQVFGVHRM